MFTTAPAASHKLLPDIFPLILSHLSLATRIPTALSVALTCHLLNDAIIPHVLYRDVQIGEDDALDGDYRAIRLLERLITTAESSKDHSDSQGLLGSSTTTPNQCVRHLCIQIQNAEDPITGVLQRLIDLKGLPNLVLFTLHFSNSSSILPPALWRGIKDNCPNLTGINLFGVDQSNENELPYVFAMKLDQHLTSIRLDVTRTQAEGEEDPPKFDLFNIPSKLHTLDLSIYYAGGACVDATGLLSFKMPHLHTLILDNFVVINPAMATEFWRAHPGIEWLELRDGMDGDWFHDFESDMLPNLKVLKCDFRSAKILLPFMSKSLVSLYLIDTYSAQAVYLLRNIPEGGILPRLRALGIQRRSWKMDNETNEGIGWREDHNGRVIQEFNQEEIARAFDGNYLMSISKAVPNLEHLELMGTSDDTIDSIAASLRLMPKLNRLTLSDPDSGKALPFFPWSYTWAEYADSPHRISKDQFKKYRPPSFDEAVRDLANGCPTLETVTFSNMIPAASMMRGLSARIFREPVGGLMKEARRIRAWGNIMGMEEGYSCVPF
ncbi:hypothetical protein H0H92_001470 [Tricholoma furcatifolium]|nr:hypothetical protein H0H92_001470 [Tricholoma furcatifolium]